MWNWLNAPTKDKRMAERYKTRPVYVAYKDTLQSQDRERNGKGAHELKAKKKAQVPIFISDKQTLKQRLYKRPVKDVTWWPMDQSKKIKQLQHICIQHRST